MICRYELSEILIIEGLISYGPYGGSAITILVKTTRYWPLIGSLYLVTLIDNQLLFLAVGSGFQKRAS